MKRQATRSSAASKRVGTNGARATSAKSVDTNADPALVASTENQSPVRGEVPQIPFRYFRTSIEALKVADALPLRIDRSVWANKHFDATDAELVPAFRFLGLIDDERRPSARLKRLVASFDTQDWPSSLASVIEQSYADIFAASNGQASPNHIIEIFRERYGLRPVRARVAVGFFVHAAREAMLDVGPFLATVWKAPHKKSSSEDALSKLLLDRLPPFEASWSDEVKIAWFVAFNDLLARTRKAL